MSHLNLPPVQSFTPPNYAERVKDMLVSSAERFRRGCEKDGEQCSFIVDAGGREIEVSRIGAVSPELLHFIGFDTDGAHCEVILHYTKLNFRMTAHAERAEMPPSTRIGFHERYLSDQDDETTSI